MGGTAKHRGTENSQPRKGIARGGSGIPPQIPAITPSYPNRIAEDIALDAAGGGNHPIDPELARLVAAWPTLAANVKAAILALIG